MKIISTKVHGIVDYLVALVLIASPWLFGFNNDGAQTYVPVTLGMMTLLYSLVTNYEYSLLKVISFRAHLVLDVGSAIFLAVSPWLFGFSEHVYLPHLMLGLFELGAVALTEKTVRSVNRKHAHA